MAPVMPSRSSLSPAKRLMLLALGLLAVALHLWAAVAPVTTAAAGTGFVAEVCTSHGVAPPGGDPAPAGHDCCKLCGAGAPLLMTAALPAVSPAPTSGRPLRAGQATVLPPSLLSAHAPRGPPRA